MTIGFDLGHDLDLDFFKVKYGICYISAKIVPIATNKKQTYRLSYKLLMWPSNLTLAVALTLKYGILYISAKNGPIAMTQKENISFEASNWTLGFDLSSDLDLELSRSNMESAISLTKWSDWLKTKSKHIDWTICLKWEHQISPCPWPDYEFSRLNSKIATSQRQMVWLPHNEKYAYRMNWRPQWLSSLTPAMFLNGEV